MAEQNFSEMLKMQNDAKRRVMEMQNRSRFAAEQMNRELQREDEAHHSQATSGNEKKAVSSVLPIKGYKTEETERMFILSLCMLLSSEGADEALIVALMYLLT